MQKKKKDLFIKYIIEYSYEINLNKSFNKPILLKFYPFADLLGESLSTKNHNSRF